MAKSREKPTFTKGGPIMHNDLQAIADKAWESGEISVDESSGLSVVDNGRHKTIGYTNQRVAEWAKVAVQISAGTSSGPVRTKAAIDLQYLDDNDALQPYGGPSDDVLNSVLFTVAVGSIIQVKWVREDWAVDVAPCSNS